MFFFILLLFFLRETILLIFSQGENVLEDAKGPAPHGAAQLTPSHAPAPDAIPMTPWQQSETPDLLPAKSLAFPALNWLPPTASEWQLG